MVGGQILTKDIKEHVLVTETPKASKKFDMPGTLAFMEREAIIGALTECRGNRTHSARRLGVGIRTLQRKLKTYGKEKFLLNWKDPNKGAHHVENFGAKL